MLKLLNMSRFSRSLVPITSADLFARPGEFNSDGLFSERIFGPLGSQERRKSFSFINLYTHVIHPSALKILIQLNRKIEKFISTEQLFSVDETGNLVPDESGVTGLVNFIELFPKIKFRGDTPTRESLIKVIQESYKDGTLFIDKIPVIPPDFRNAYQDQDGNWVVDSLNDIYQSIIRKTFQVRSVGSSGVLFDLLSYGVQTSILDHDSYIRTKVEKKNGLIRSQMLGKRIDFSGRAVITPGPQLKVNEVGVPIRIAIMLFEPFIIHHILYSGRIDSVKLGREIKKFTGLEMSLDTVRKVIKAIHHGDSIQKELFNTFWDTCEFVMRDRVVICKRDPVLHAESVRGFTPVLVKGNTLQLCTLQTGGFNADFDGDQMAIYHPLTKQSQEEVKTKMMKLVSGDSSRELSFALSKEMFVGLYLLTKDEEEKSNVVHVTSLDLDKATNPYIPVMYKGKRTTMGRAIFNNSLPSGFPFIDEQIDKKKVGSIIKTIVSKYTVDEVRDCVSKLERLGFKFATIISPSLTIEDIDLPPEMYKLKDKLTGASTEEASTIISQLEKMLIDHLKGTGLYDLMISGAGKGWGQPVQMLVTKGIIADPKGRILPTIKGSFSDGLNTIEFFDASRGARKGLADRVLNTASTGYLSRKLSYVLNPVEADLYLKDCKTNRTVTLKLDKDLIDRLKGRYVIKNGEVKQFIEEDYKVGDLVNLRTPIYCTSKKICHTCYGKLLERHKSPYIGIVAAQIIGERGTQLIMRTFHTGGAVIIKKKDVLTDIVHNDPYISSTIPVKYLKQDKNTVISLKQCVIDIDTDDYDFKSNILLDEEKGTLWVKNLLSKITFEDSMMFNMILDYPVELLVYSFEKIGKVLRFYFPEGKPVFEVSLEAEDIKAKAAYVERLASGKEIFKDVAHLLLKLHKAYKEVSDMDLVHYEVFISNVLRDKHDHSIPARLGKTWNPVLISMKHIVFEQGFLQGLSFENIGKSINTGLTSTKYDEPSILEKVLMGTIIQSKENIRR